MERRAFKGQEKDRTTDADKQQAAQKKENAQASGKGYAEVDQARRKGNVNLPQQKNTADAHLPKVAITDKSKDKFDRNNIQRDFGKDGSPAKGKEYRAVPKEQAPTAKQGCYGSRMHASDAKANQQSPKQNQNQPKTNQPQPNQQPKKPDSGPSR